MTNVFDEDDNPADAADRARGRNDRDTTHIDKDGKLKLVSFVTRVERLNEDKDAIGEDIKAIFAEAKAMGFDTKIMRETIRRRKMSRSERDEHDTMLELYEGVFG
jgi:uncharacterized protein (UPF0335 family)